MIFLDSTCFLTFLDWGWTKPYRKSVPVCLLAGALLFGTVGLRDVELYWGRVCFPFALNTRARRGWLRLFRAPGARAFALQYSAVRRPFERDGRVSAPRSYALGSYVFNTAAT